MTTLIRSSEEIEEVERKVQPYASGAAPVPAHTTFELLELFRNRLHNPSRDEVKRVVKWLVPCMVITGALVALGDGPIGAALAGLFVLIILTWRLPHFAGYVIIAGAPFVLGFERDQILPQLRVNEALLAVLLLVMATRWLVYSRRVVLRLRSFDYAIVAIVVFGFFLPLLAQFTRLKPVGLEDVLYAAVFVRLALLYALIRFTIKTQSQVRTALGLSLFVAAGLAILGTMDSLNFLGTADRLQRWFPNEGFQVDDGRGSATMGNPIGFGVYQGMNAMIGLSMYLIGERPRRLIATAAGLCCLGVVGSGQIGPLISMSIGLLALAVATKSFWKLFRFGIPLVLVALVLLAPLAARRVEGFGGHAIDSRKRESINNSPVAIQGEALFEANPGSSWDVRLYNLETFFMPSFADDKNIIWGVTPQARVSSPRQGEEYIWIESGHLWLFWSGGIPLFLAWFGMLITGMITSRRVLRTRAGPVAVAGAAAFGALWIINVAQTFDPHMTLRGSVDIFYPLMALMMVAVPAVKTTRTVKSTADGGDSATQGSVQEPLDQLAANGTG